MVQTPEAQAFISRVLELPKAPAAYDALHDVLQPSLDDEAELRTFWATTRDHERLKDPYVGLVDVFDAPEDTRITHARVVQGDEELSAKYIMPLPTDKRRKESEPSMVADIEEFKKNWAIFSEGSLSQLLDWTNVVAAGGSVLACLTPLEEKDKVSKRAIRKFYHSNAYPTSDVDLFLWGMTPEQAEAKIIKIFEAVRDSVPWDVTCVRSKHTISIHSQYPYRSVQIVLRLYSSPAEILAGFDIDAPCCAYDGDRVWANPRAVVAMMRQCNTVDISRRSPSYEVRLSKYSSRGYEVYDPTLRRHEIDPTIYERAISRIEGLARLLVLEKLKDNNARESFLNERRALRGRPTNYNSSSRYQKTFKGDLKSQESLGVQMNDYDVTSLHIPYGPGWDARRIEKLVYQTDLGMNSTFNPKNKGRRLHRHPAFFGTVQECIEDCCEHCPKPVDDDEKKLKEEDEKQYIEGRIIFITEDPGRQSMTGSFNPIDVGEWTAQVYIGPTEKLFAAIASHDRDTVGALLKEGVDPNRRDHVGRAPIHLAILVKASQITCDLIDSGARITARILDGRAPLHLACQMNLPEVVKKLLEKSALNAEAIVKEPSNADDGVAPQANVDVEERVRASSEDDWTSEDDGVISLDDADASDEGSSDGSGGNEDEEDADDDDEDEDERSGRPSPKQSDNPEPTASGDIPEDEKDQPDIIEIDLADWDVQFTPLCYAIVFASPIVIETLLAAGADVKLAPQPNTPPPAYHPLLVTTLRDNEDEACQIARVLVAGGAVSSHADSSAMTIFHRIVASGRYKVAAELLKYDPKAKLVLDFPEIQWSSANFPLTTAISNRSYAMAAVLFSNEVKVPYREEDVHRARRIARDRMSSSEDGALIEQAVTALESAFQNHDDISNLLIALGVEVNCGLKGGYSRYNSSRRRSFWDYTQWAMSYLKYSLEKTDRTETTKAPPEVPKNLSGWAAHLYSLFHPDRKVTETDDTEALKAAEKQKLRAAKQKYELQSVYDYWADVEKVLTSKGAKSWNEIYTHPDKKSDAKVDEDIVRQTADPDTVDPTPKTRYRLFSNNYNREYVPEHQLTAYGELYDACFVGDNAAIEVLCSAETSKGSAGPLQISVQVADPNNAYSQTGFTPLLAAVAGRRWSTARLIVSILVAQYQKEEVEEPKFSVHDISLDDDSDDQSDDDSCGSDDTVEPRTHYIDVATRSAVKCQISPEQVLGATFQWVDTEGTTSSGTLLSKAVSDGDLEAFKMVADLYELTTEPVDIGTGVLSNILAKDNSELLDEYIRRTGYGIAVHLDEDGNAHVEVLNDKNRIYLGLNVHGKKRKDLAHQNDPNAYSSNTAEKAPIVWQAARSHSSAILEYLTTNRPLAAYRFYSTNSGEARAEKIRHMSDFDGKLPRLLGWSGNSFGESALTAGLLSHKLDVIKLLLNKGIGINKSTLHDSVQFIGYNSLMIAVHSGCPTEIIDFLLSRNVSATVTDQHRGWNVLHLASHRGNHELVGRLLEKLPKETSELLLVQQSKRHLHIPLHIAVKQGNLKIVKAILKFTSNPGMILQRDEKGSNCIHLAVQDNRPEIFDVLREATPRSSLFIENGVGDTVLEIVSRRALASKASKKPDSNSQELYAYGIRESPPRVDLDKLEIELPRLRESLSFLVASGELAEDTPVHKEFSSFLKTMEQRVEEAKAAIAGFVFKDDEEEEERVWAKTSETDTINAVVEATSSSIGERHLVHLIDVQRSVEGDLRHVAENALVSHEDDGGLDPEESEDESEKNKSSLYLNNMLSGLFANA